MGVISRLLLTETLWFLVGLVLILVYMVSESSIILKIAAPIAALSFIALIITGLILIWTD